MTSTTLTKESVTKVFAFDRSMPVFPEKRKGAYWRKLAPVAALEIAFVTFLFIAVINGAAQHGLAALWLPIVFFLVFAAHFAELQSRLAMKEDTRREKEREYYYKDEVVEPVLDYLYSFGYKGYPLRAGNFSNFTAPELIRTLNTAFDNENKESYCGLRIYNPETGERTDQFFVYTVKILNRNSISVTTSITEGF
jgi:hypothetical protein